MSKFKQIYHSSFQLLQIKTSYQKDNTLIYLRTKDMRDILVEIYLRARWAKRLEQKIAHLGKRWADVISTVVCESRVRASSPPSRGSKQLLRLLQGLRDSTSPAFVRSWGAFSNFRFPMSNGVRPFGSLAWYRCLYFAWLIGSRPSCLPVTSLPLIYLH